MDTAEHVGHLAADVARLATLDPAALDRDVPGCPGWDGTALLEHLGGVHRWATSWLVADDPDAFPDFPPPSDLRGPALLDWVVEGGQRLLGTFRADDPERPCGSFMGRTTVAWWARRQAIETAIHRWDAQSVVGGADPIPAGLAVDAVDEWCTFRVARSAAGPPASVHLHATDAAGEWFIEAGEPFRWTREHKKGDVAARAAASDLLLVLWGRLDRTVVDVVGRAEVLDRFLASS